MFGRVSVRLVYTLYQPCICIGFVGRSISSFSRLGSRHMSVGNLRPAGRIRPATLLTSGPRPVSATYSDHPQCLVTHKTGKTVLLKDLATKKNRRSAAQIIPKSNCLEVDRVFEDLQCCTGTPSRSRWSQYIMSGAEARTIWSFHA